MAIQFRKVEPTDAPTIYRIIEAARACSTASIGPKWTEAQVEAECLSFGLIAHEDASLRAFILWRDTGAAWEISFLATDPPFQGRGLMKSLIEQMKLKKPGDRAIWLEVHEQNVGARAVYEKAGFTQTGQRPHYYSDGGTAILYNYG